MKDFREISEAVVAGDEDKVTQLTKAAIDNGGAAGDILNGALLPAMDIVGGRMKSGEMFIPEVLMSARAMQGGLDILLPLMVSSDVQSKGKIVIGTVEGDLHDIGKNLVCMMLRGAGFDVIDLGVNVTAGNFIEAINEHKADILGMSALLTTTMPKMAETIRALEEAGIRDKVKVMAGGAPVNKEFVEKIRADRFAPDAATAVDCAKEMLAAQ